MANIHTHVTISLTESADEARALPGANGDNKSFECCFKREISEFGALITELVEDARVLVGVPGHSRSGCIRAGCPEGEMFELPELILLTFWSALDHLVLALHFDTILATVSALLATVLGPSKKNTPESRSAISLDFFGVRISMPSVRRWSSNCRIRNRASFLANLSLASSASARRRCFASSKMSLSRDAASGSGCLLGTLDFL